MSVCLGRAPVMVINDPLKWGSPKPAFWAPYTRAAIRGQLWHKPKRGARWVCAAGTTHRTLLTSPLHARGLRPTCRHELKTTRQPASSRPSLGSRGGGWETCCKCPVTPARSRPLARTPPSSASLAADGGSRPPPPRPIPTRDSTALSLPCHSRRRICQGAICAGR